MTGRWDREVHGARLARLATRGVFVGTSSWKYPGWCSLLYDERRYAYHGRFAQARFERLCLAEYALVFKTVCVDAAYYKFPDGPYLEGMMSQVPADFRFALKVTDRITLPRFSNLPRFGLHAGKANEDYLNADLFANAFLAPCVPHRDRIGLLIFEFSRFYPSDYVRGRDFAEALDRFLSRLPSGWPYGVEIRNRQFLHPDYFSVLARHGTTHVYNNWTAMPPIEEQRALPESRTTSTRLAARFLLKPGRTYEEAVNRFSPYDHVREINEPGRRAGAALIREAAESDGKTVAFLYVNNRFEGNALQTISAMLEASSA